MESLPQRSHSSLLLRGEYLLAVALLAFNDALLKTWNPSWISGKLSDFAGLFFAPILLLVLLEVIPQLRSKCTFGMRRSIAYGAVAAVFSLAQFTNFGAAIYAAVFYPARLIPTWRGGFGLTQDPTDLVALIALVGSLWWSDRMLAKDSVPYSAADHERSLMVVTPE